MRNTIDLNCDMGESFGAWKMGNDEELMKYVSSINVASGFHAGDPTTIRKTIETALKYNVAIGAHPSYPDLQGFGRRELKMTPEEIFDSVVYQVSALSGVCRALGASLSHVKPHGALYNVAARDSTTAEAIAKAVLAVDPGLILYGLSGSFLIERGNEVGLKTANEAFADRRYEANGQLRSRLLPDSLITDSESATAQVKQMCLENTVQAVDGTNISIEVDSICIHGDGPTAAVLAKSIADSLNEINVSIRSLRV